jgi:hypothetical protein
MPAAIESDKFRMGAAILSILTTILVLVAIAAVLIVCPLLLIGLLASMLVDKRLIPPSLEADLHQRLESLSHHS